MVGSSKPIEVSNFPVVKIHEGYPNISYLQVSTWKGQYQLFWNDGGAGEACLLVQCLTTETPYPKNQKSLAVVSNSVPKTFKLVIDLAVEDGLDSIKLVTLD